MEKKKEELARHQRREQVMHSLYQEIERAESKHPGWPTDPLVGLSVISKEMGEANQAAIEHTFRQAPDDDIRKEVEHIACTAIRFLWAWADRK